MKLPSLTIGHLRAKLPIIQGGMGIGISLSGLAGAVAKAGGIGIISGVQIGFREPDFVTNTVAANCRAIESELAKARSIAPDGIIGINFMAIAEHFEDYVAHAARCGVDLIISGAGLPMTLPRLVEGTKTKIMPIVSSLRACRLILNSWLKKHNRLPDGVVVEGPEAGGHLGFKLEDLQQGTNQSLSEILNEVIPFVRAFAAEHGTDIPVIAAGGISTHEDITHMFSLGVSGVQIGTAFVATEECDASATFKQAYLQATSEDVEIIKSPTGFAARAINTPFLQKAYSAEGIPPKRCFRCMPVAVCSPDKTPYCLSQSLFQSANGEDGLVFCGARVGEIHALTTVPKLIAQLSEEEPQLQPAG